MGRLAAAEAARQAAKEIAARQLRLGQMIAGLESALAAIDVAARAGDLLSREDRDRLCGAREVIAGLGQRAWELSRKADDHG